MSEQMAMTLYKLATYYYSQVCVGGHHLTHPGMQPPHLLTHPGLLLSGPASRCGCPGPSVYLTLHVTLWGRPRPGEGAGA